jgi:hypothetical protein
MSRDMTDFDALHVDRTLRPGDPGYDRELKEAVERHKNLPPNIPL